MQEISATGGGRSWSRAPGVTTNMNANRSVSIPDAATNDAVVSGFALYHAERMSTHKLFCNLQSDLAMPVP